jgi:hypothetical protein
MAQSQGIQPATRTYSFMREEGILEKVRREAWRWIAIYKDGTRLAQFDDELRLFHQFAEIDQSELYSFTMEHDSYPEQTLLFQKGMKLVHFYRNTKLADAPWVKLYFFGYETATDKRLICILPNGKTAIVGDASEIKLQGMESN